MDKSSYDICIKEINEKDKIKSIDFFISCKIFYGFNKKLFEIKLFDYFVLNRIDRFKKLFSEGDTPENIFIIKKGEFEITTNKNILELFRKGKNG